MTRILHFLVASSLCAGVCLGAAAGSPLNAVACGADPTGKEDCTRLLQELHSRKGPVCYPNGTYRFNGESLDLSGGVTFESRGGVVIRNDLSPLPVVVFDNHGNLIGLQQNPLERDERVLGPKGQMQSGSLVPPPLSKTGRTTAVDVVAHWYNDGGLECRRSGGGWVGWYYWSWAFHSPALSGGRAGAPYDPARHPLLGFYRGDDPVVLDWQCYWLAEYGVKAVTLCGGSVDFDQWQQAGAEGHWLYQLFHHVPNFQRLQYVLWPGTPWLKATPENQRKVEAGWMRVIERGYLRYRNFYALEAGGKKYPVLFVYEGEALRGVFDNYRGAERTAAFCARVAARFQAAGYGGVALFVRHPTSEKLLNRAALERQGVLYFDASYSDDYGTGNTYPERVASFAPPAGPRTILNTCTARHSQAPHPSKWVCPGHAPALFGEQVRKAVAHVQANGMPRIITCYNVAEWAEGGPGLQPNRQDRFGYLEALRDAVAAPPGAAAHSNNRVSLGR
jgi:hypothetical protein